MSKYYIKHAKGETELSRSTQKMLQNHFHITR